MTGPGRPHTVSSRVETEAVAAGRDVAISQKNRNEIAALWARAVGPPSPPLAMTDGEKCMTVLKPARDDYIEAVRDLHARTPLAKTMGVELDIIEPGRVTAFLPLRPELCQQHGVAHAGTLASLADMVCGLAAYSLMDEGSSVMSVNINISLMRPAETERLRAEGRVVKAGKKVYFTEADIFADSAAGERLTTKVTATMVRVAEE